MKTILTTEFFFEVFILLVHPIPYYEKVFLFEIIDMLDTKTTYVEVYYMLSDFLYAFMYLRFYFLIKTFLNLSIYADLYSKKICSKY